MSDKGNKTVIVIRYSIFVIGGRESELGIRNWGNREWDIARGFDGFALLTQESKKSWQQVKFPTGL
jgi:hypothetical protein